MGQGYGSIQVIGPDTGTPVGAKSTTVIGPEGTEAGAEIIERGVAIDAIRSLIDSTLAGSGGFLFLAGEAGIGKTTLLGLAHSMAGTRMSVAWARGQSMEQSIAFSLMHQCLADLERSLTTDAGALGSLSDPGLEPGQIYFRVFALLRDIASRGPLLLVFDDLHLADPDSLRLVSFFVRRTAGTPIAIVAAGVLWPPDAADMARLLAREGLARVETLLPLSPEGAERVLERYLGSRLDRSMASQTWSATGGNPMLLHEVGFQLRSGRGLTRMGRATGELGQNLLLARFGALSPAAARVAQAAAALGNQFRVSLLTRVVDDNTTLSEALNELHGSGIISEPSPGWGQFRHPLFRQALYEDAMPWLRAKLHERAFQVFRELGDNSAAAVHAVAADLVFETDAAATVEEAGREAIAVGAWATAVGHLTSAAKMSGSRPGAGLLQALGLAQWARGEAAEAVATYRELLAIPDLPDEHKPTATHMMGRAHLSLGNQGEARASLSDAARLALAWGDRRRAASARLDEAIAAWHSSGPRVALSLAESAVELAGGAEQEVLDRAKVERAVLQVQAGVRITDEDYRAIADRWVESRRPEDRAWPWGTLRAYIDLSLLSESVHDARWAHEVAERSAESAGSVPNLISLALAQAQLLISEGELEEALSSLERAAAIVAAVPVLEPLVEAMTAYVLQHLGRPWQTARHPESPEAIEEATYWLPTLWWGHIRATHAAVKGNSRLASDRYLQVEELSARIGLADPSTVPWTRSAILAHLAVERRDDAVRLIESVEAVADGLTARWPRIVTLSGRALLAESRGEKLDALGLFEELLRTHDDAKGRLRLERITSLTLFGEFLRRVGRPSRARALLEEAVGEAEASGAVLLAELGRERLAVVSGARRGFRENPEALTPQEERVVKLVLSGRSNAEVAAELRVSTRTIETHLGHVYTKLGIRSRNELMARNLARLADTLF